MRIRTGGILAAFVIVLMTPGPAQAAMGYHDASSNYDAVADKSATVTCPAGKKALGSGGSIQDGNGTVALTGIVPAADLSSVTAYGRARPSHIGDWSVTAIVICSDAQDPERAFGGGITTATATCPANKILYSTGFRAFNVTGEQFVDEVVPSVTLDSVQVHAVGSNTLFAYGICAVSIYKQTRLDSTPAYPAPGEHTTVPKPVWDGDLGSWVFGAGVKATGRMLDSLAPNPALDGARARAWALTLIPGKKSMVSFTANDDGGGTSVYGTLIGSWY